MREAAAEKPQAQTPPVKSKARARSERGTPRKARKRGDPPARLERQRTMKLYDDEPVHERGRISISDPKALGGPRKSVIVRNYPRQLSWAQEHRYRERTMVERVIARLKDEFGARYVRVRAGAKVTAHLIFGVLALTADQLLRLVCNSS